MYCLRPLLACGRLPNQEHQLRSERRGESYSATSRRASSGLPPLRRRRTSAVPCLVWLHVTARCMQPTKRGTTREKSSAPEKSPNPRAFCKLLFLMARPHTPARPPAQNFLASDRWQRPLRNLVRPKELRRRRRRRRRRSELMVMMMMSPAASKIDISGPKGNFPFAVAYFQFGPNRGGRRAASRRLASSRQTRRKTPPPMSDHIVHEEWKRMRCTATKENRPRGT